MGLLPAAVLRLFDSLMSCHHSSIMLRNSNTVQGGSTCVTPHIHPAKSFPVASATIPSIEKEHTYVDVSRSVVFVISSV